MLTDIFFYVQFIGRFLNQTIIDSFSFGAFNWTGTYTLAKGQDIADYFVDSLLGIGDFIALTDNYRLLFAETNYRLTGIKLLSKGPTGFSTIKSEVAVNLYGTRPTADLGEPASPTSTFSVYFPTVSYGQKGCKWGLGGVYESDGNAGLVNVSSPSQTTIESLITAYMGGVALTSGDFEAVATPGKISRIEYTTEGGNQAYRMPLLSADTPAIYQVNRGAVNPVLGTNNHRKPGRGI